MSVSSMVLTGSAYRWTISGQEWDLVETTRVSQSVHPYESQAKGPRAKCNDSLWILKSSDSVNHSNFVAKVLNVSAHNKMFVYI